MLDIVIVFFLVIFLGVELNTYNDLSRHEEDRTTLATRDLNMRQKLEVINSLFNIICTDLVTITKKSVFSLLEEMMFFFCSHF